MNKSKYPIRKSESEWKKILSKEEYRILREKGTEYPFTGKYNNHFDAGVYLCKGCGQELYKSQNKFDSGCGWPSYDAALPGSLEYIQDTSHGMIRTEIICATCDAHLGHVFDDGPEPTGQRYCVNSLSIQYKEIE